MLLLMSEIYDTYFWQQDYLKCSSSRCNFGTVYLHPNSDIHLFVMSLCKHREDDAFYDLCRAFDIPDGVRVKIETSNASLKLRCFDVLHRVYHRDNELTLAVIMTKLSGSNDDHELPYIIME